MRGTCTIGTHYTVVVFAKFHQSHPVHQVRASIVAQRSVLGAPERACAVALDVVLRVVPRGDRQRGTLAQVVAARTGTGVSRRTGRSNPRNDSLVQRAGDAGGRDERVDIPAEVRGDLRAHAVRGDLRLAVAALVRPRVRAVPDGVRERELHVGAALAHEVRDAVAVIPAVAHDVVLAIGGDLVRCTVAVRVTEACPDSDQA